MDFCPTSVEAARAIEIFRREAATCADSGVSAIPAKLADLPGRMVVVAGDRPCAMAMAQAGLPESWAKIVRAFSVVCSEEDDSRRELGWEAIECFGTPLGMGCRVGSISWVDRQIYPCRSLMWRVRGALQEPEYFYLVFPGARTPISSFDMGVLADLGQIEMGRLPIHAASVVYRGKLLLLLGPSGAGKSTAAGFAKAEGGLVLDDDQFLLTPSADGEWTGRGWGASLSQSPCPVSAIAVLVKAKQDSLIPISRPATARMLVESSLQCSGFRLWQSQVEAILRLSADIARNVPGFLLQFTESPAFLSLLCEQVSED